MNGATCENSPLGQKGYDCICAPGFTGTHCQTGKAMGNIV